MGERLIHKITQLCLTRLLKNFSHRGIELFVPRQTWVSGKFWLNILKSRKHFWWVLKCCFLVIFTSQRVLVFSFCWENSLESGENSISERLNVKIFLGSMPPDPPRGCYLWCLAVPPAQRWLLTLTTQPSTSKLSDNPGVVNRGCPWTGTPCFVYIFSLDFKRTLIRPIDAFHCCNSKTQTSQLTDWFIIKRLSI